MARGRGSSFFLHNLKLKKVKFKDMSKIYHMETFGKFLDKK